jgi:hypothetical protein
MISLNHTEFRVQHGRKNKTGVEEGVKNNSVIDKTDFVSALFPT